MTKLSMAVASRRRALAAALLSLVAWATFGCAHAASLEEIKKRGYIVVATEDDYRPFEFVKDGKPTGFDNEMVDALQKYAPFQIRHEILPFTGILAGVATGKYDIAITGATMTKDRIQSLDFASPIADATDYYVKRKNDDSIKSIKDLSGKPVGVQAGSAQLAHLSQLQAQIEKSGGKIGKIVQYTSYPEAYQDLALGRTDYVVNTIVNLTTLVNQKPGVFALGRYRRGTAEEVVWPVFQPACCLHTRVLNANELFRRTLDLQRGVDHAPAVGRRYCTGPADRTWDGITALGAPACRCAFHCRLRELAAGVPARHPAAAVLRIA
jgi:polar amino acid transport system substrate-binding protein